MPRPPAAAAIRSRSERIRFLSAFSRFHGRGRCCTLARSVSALDRAAERRDDEAWIAAQRASPAARFLGFDGEARAPVRSGRLRLLDAAAAGDAPANFLGLYGDAPVFGLREPVAHDAFADAEWLGLRA